MFTTDSRTEKFLDTVGVRQKYSNDLTFDMLDPDWMMENLGRSQVRVEKAVNEYRLLMDRGSAAPAPILWRNPVTNLYEVLDGAQRLAAAQLRQPVIFSAYVVISDSAVLARRIRVFANYRLQGGYQESSDWTLERAIEKLVATGQMSIEECAEFGGWTVTQVKDKAQVVDFRRAIQSVGGPEKLPDSIVRIIAKHAAKGDFEAASTQIAKFTNAIQRMRLTTEEAEPFIEEFFSVPRSKGKLFKQFETKWEEFHEADGVAARLADPSRARYQPMTPEGRVLKSLRSTLTTAEKVRDAGELIYGMEEYFQVLNQTKVVLQQIDRMSRSAKRGKQD